MADENCADAVSRFHAFFERENIALREKKTSLADVSAAYHLTARKRVKIGKLPSVSRVVSCENPPVDLFKRHGLPAAAGDS